MIDTRLYKNSNAIHIAYYGEYLMSSYKNKNYSKKPGVNHFLYKIRDASDSYVSRILFSGVHWGVITKVLNKVNKLDYWESWHQSWRHTALQYETIANIAEEKCHYVTARQALLLAATCHHFSEFMYFDYPKKKEAIREKVSEIFIKAIPYLPYPVETISIKYKGQSLPGYFLSSQFKKLAPTVIIVNGLDTAKEVELMKFAKEFYDRGLSVLLFDGPGQGVLAGKLPMVMHFDEIIGSVLDYLEYRLDVSVKNIGIFGVGYGGYLAARSAANYPFQLNACVNLSGRYDHDCYHMLNALDRKNYRYIFGVNSDEKMEKLAIEKLNLKDVNNLSIPLLCIYGRGDNEITDESILRMLDWAKGEKEFLFYKEGSQDCINYYQDYIPRISDWLVERLNVNDVVTSHRGDEHSKKKKVTYAMQ